MPTLTCITCLFQNYVWLQTGVIDVNTIEIACSKRGCRNQYGVVGTTPSSGRRQPPWRHAEKNSKRPYSTLVHYIWLGQNIKEHNAMRLWPTVGTRCCTRMQSISFERKRTWCDLRVVDLRKLARKHCRFYDYEAPEINSTVKKWWRRRHLSTENESNIYNFDPNLSDKDQYIIIVIVNKSPLKLKVINFKLLSFIKSGRLIVPVSTGLIECSGTTK